MASNKILLIEDVDHLGRSGDIVSVRPGYARNFLLPQKLAVVATTSAIKRQAYLQEQRKQKALVDKSESENLAVQMEGLTVSTYVKVDHDGHMYGSVSSGDIVQLIQEQASLVIEKKNLQLKHALKEIGVFEIPIKLKEGVTAQVTVKIMAEETNSQA